MAPDLYQTIAWTCIITINATLIIALLQQKIRNAKYQHEITQLLITLKLTTKILKDRYNARK